MQKITPFLWFNDKLEEAIEFYTSVFKKSRIVTTTRLPAGVPGDKDKIFTATFEIEGQEFMGLNGGPYQTSFTDAISFFVRCEDQAEIDYYWDKLTADGGKPVQCGWLKDKFGISWQIVPPIMERVLHDDKPERAERVMQAMMKMIKLDIAVLEAAYEG
jgi:predicted 3-demethylubiquinone-9 3-methyltransferase (glyoxalase superfamily)